MRITHLINSLATGGAERLVVDLCLHMRQMGHETEILTLERLDGFPARAASAAGLPVRSLGRSRFDPRLGYRARDATKSSDIVHAHLFPALYVGAWINPQIPTVYTEHSTSNRRRQSPAFVVPDRLAYARYTALLAISEGVRRNLREHLATLKLDTGVHVVPNGIDLSRFAGRLPATRGDGPLRLIAVGTLDHRKNFGEAISAISSVPNTQLTIVGDGPLMTDLSDQIKASGLDGRVELMGLRSDIPQLLGRHHALLITSTYEGFSLVAAEAMASGLPVVGPDIDGLNEVVTHDHSGLLYQRQHGGLALKVVLERLRDDEKLRSRLATAARDESARFSIAVTADTLTAMYESL